MSVNYGRVFVGDCSVAAQGACYKRALSPAAIKGNNEDPTAIGYDVQVFIPADAPLARTDTLLASIYRGDDERMAEARVTKVGGLIFCNPAE